MTIPTPRSRPALSAARRRPKTGILLAVALATFLGLANAVRAAEKLRVGHFPNVTHVQGLVAHAMSRQGKGWFEERLGPDVAIEWFTYNAGPSAMEAVFAGSLELTYVGPSPALNAYAKSRGDEVRIIAGAAEGGAALVVPAGSPLKTPADFRGKKIATPQLGNTQDVACRAWLAAGGLKITQLGGDAQVLPTANPDQLALFQQKRVDAVWTVEPWVTRLEQEAGGAVLVEQRDDPVTVLVSSAKFLKDKRGLAKKFAAAHAELTEWIKAHPEDARRLVAEELKAETRTEIAAEPLAQSLARVSLTTEVRRDRLERSVADAKAAGFLRDAPDLARLIEKP